MKILIVDDELATRRGLKTHINWTSVGIDEIVLANDGAEAFELIWESPPDILLTDIKMPRMDGLDLVKKIRTYPRFNPLRVIFLSGYSDKEYLKAAIRFGAVEYLEKPVDPRKAEEVLSQVVKDITPQRKESLCKDRGNILGYIEEFYYTDISLELLAEEFGYNPQYLSNMFKKKYGVGLRHYLRETRIRKARDMMKESELKITDISYRVGFKEYAHFSRVFKEQTGESPRNYQRKLIRERI